MSTSNDDWFSTLSEDQRSVLLELRRLILSTDERLVETIKWGQPCYSLNGLVCYLQKAKRYVTLGFQQGARLQDPERLLEGAGKDMRHIKLPLGHGVDIDACRALIQQAVRHDER